MRVVVTGASGAVGRHVADRLASNSAVTELVGLDRTVSFGVTQLQRHQDLAGFIDVAAEITRNEKQLEKLTQQVTGREKKLSNEKFVSNAPAEVVQREREQLAQLKEQLQAVENALESLRKM